MLKKTGMHTGTSNSEKSPLVKTKKFKIFTIIVGSIVGLVLVVYLAGCFFFSNHFYPKTTMDTIDMSWMSQERAVAALDGKAAGYQIGIEGKGLSFDLSGEDVGLNLDAKKVTSQAVKSNNLWQWPLNIFGTHDISKYLVATYDKDAVAKAVETQVQSVNDTATQPINATISFDKDSGIFQVTPEQAGTVLEQSSVTKTIETAVSLLDPAVEITDKDLLQPTITTKDKRLEEACSSANTMIKTDLDLKMGTSQVAELGPKEIAAWVQLDKDMKVTFDDTAFGGWIEEIVDSCNTVGTRRTYTRPDGKTVTVSGGSYGWEIDDEAFRTQIRKSMSAGETGDFKIPTTQEGTGFQGSGRDWGKRYCDIDLSEQHARYYDDNGALIWESDIVSGKPEGGHSTPTGVYKLNSGKSAPATLTGQILPGETKPEYITKVAYWMPFVRNSIGLHDATWQSSFGGSRYTSGFGSHGCINLPLAKAKELYSLISVGDPVITHN